MDITLENVDKDDIHTAQGPTLQFDLVNASAAAMRAMLTVDEGIHIGYPSKAGTSVRSNRTLGGGLHAVSVLIAARATDGARDYDFSIAINGTPVVRAVGNVPADKQVDTELGLFQLQVN